MKQRNSASNSSQAKKFKLPSIFGQKTIEAPNCMRPMKFNNLSELANAHLSSSPLANEPSKPHSENINIPQQSNQMKFVIPKWSGGSGSCSMSPNSTGESLTPHEVSLKKIMDLKRLHISSNHSKNDTENTSLETETVIFDDNSVDCQPFSIDLASALNGPHISNTIIPPVKPIVEEIDFKFIDCDIIEASDPQPFVTQDCSLNISNILEQHFASRTKNTTAFGNILCSKYKRKQLPSIQHGFVTKYQIKPFNFDIKLKQKAVKLPSIM